MVKKRRKRATRKKKICIREIEYYNEDLDALLEYIQGFKSDKSSKKNITVRRSKLKSYLNNTRAWADSLLEKLYDRIPASISLVINQKYYEYWGVKDKFGGLMEQEQPLEEKLEVLVRAAAIIECGKMYKIRSRLKNPKCISIKYFLKDYYPYFCTGINGIVNIQCYIYALDKIDAAVNNNIERERSGCSFRRMFYIHVGKTNSGKTYTSMQMLKNAKTGAYLSPLRLLALEISDSLNAQGVPCSLVTGEEEMLLENATHISSTVELGDFYKEYDVAVIDECQMISDYSRGHAWTKAIMNMQAREICLCTAPEAVDILIRLIDSCGDYYEIINHRRTTPLVVQDKPFSMDDVQEGDALVSFSKQKVNAIGAQLINRGVPVSVLYGALPYTVRKQQFESFIQGKSKVLVTTDAIGMGVNLPVRRIVFMEVYKFDGKVNRLLNSGEIKQIAGRAGRRGIFDTGYVTANSVKELKFIKGRLNAKTEKVEGMCVNFPKKILEDEYIKLGESINAWDMYDVPEFYVKESLNEAADNIKHIRNLYNRLGIQKDRLFMFEMATMPVDSRNYQVKRLWLDYIEQRLSGYRTLRKPYMRGRSVEDFLTYSKMLDTYFMCGKVWSMDIDLQWLNSERQKCSAALIDNLINDVGTHTRHCLGCGKLLDWNNSEDYCDDCLEQTKQN